MNRATVAALLLATSLAGSSWTPGSGVGAAQGPAAPSGPLVGAIDVHVHSYPDDRPRSIHAIDVAKLARTRGMRAIVLKNHWESTAGMAYIVRQVVPDIEVLGGIALNRTVGGINAAAVDHMARVTGGFGRIVWMPTFDSENQVRTSKETRPFVSVSKGGELLPEVKAVIGVIAKHNLVLATGHSTPAEGLMLLREARQQGVRQMIVTHAIQTPVLMNVAQMKEAASLGAFIEFVGGSPEGQGARGETGRHRRRDQAGGCGVFDSLLGPGSAGQSSAAGRIRSVHPGASRARHQRSRSGCDVEAEPRAAPRPAVTLFCLDGVSARNLEGWIEDRLHADSGDRLNVHVWCDLVERSHVNARKHVAKEREQGGPAVWRGNDGWRGHPGQRAQFGPNRFGNRRFIVLIQS